MQKNLDLSSVPCRKTDVLVVGSGGAGLMAASEIDCRLKVTLLSKLDINTGSTYYAQGGIACVQLPEDSIESHIEDTLFAGAGLCEPEAVKVLVEEAPMALEDLMRYVDFDRDRKGVLRLAQEGAHSFRRILHAGGDATGKAIQLGLVKKFEEHKNIHLEQDYRAVDILLHEGRAVGVLVWKASSGKFLRIYARALILASGGYAQLYHESTNPSTSTGDGVAMAIRAGAVVRDMEFVQFHPTALYIAGAPRFLISEAMRGEGALLRNATGDRFMSAYHELAELAPRDIVSRSITTEMIKSGESCVFLDLTHMEASKAKKRFPTIYNTCQSFGIDITRQWVPVRPAAHYTMGGIETDCWGRTSVAGLFACGEVASTGVHGANRLASNSLLETLVFGRRVAKVIQQSDFPDLDSISLKHAASSPPRKVVNELMPDDQIRTLTALMSKKVGINRHHRSLESSLRRLEQWQANQIAPRRLSGKWLDFINLNQVGLTVCRAALWRKESRGSHFREDYPEKDDLHFAIHSRQILTKLL